MTRTPATIVLMLLLGLVIAASPGCRAVNPNLWGFPVTSAIFGSDGNRQASTYEYTDGSSGPDLRINDARAAAAAVGLIIAAAVTFYLAILALDLLALIVTAPHDIYWLIRYGDAHSRWSAYLAEQR